MTIKQTLTLIKALGIPARYISEVREFRITSPWVVNAEREACAYYTDCRYDAVYTALAMVDAHRVVVADAAALADAPIEAQVSTAVDTFYTDVYTIQTIADNGSARTFKAGNLEFADTIAKRYPVAVVLCNDVQLCVWANGQIVAGNHSDRCRALDAEYVRERSANLSSESDWNGCE